MVYDKGVARRLEQIFDEDLAYSKKIDYRAWKRRGLGDRLFELLAIPIRDFL